MKRGRLKEKAVFFAREERLRKMNEKKDQQKENVGPAMKKIMDESTLVFDTIVKAVSEFSKKCMDEGNLLSETSILCGGLRFINTFAGRNMSEEERRLSNTYSDVAAQAVVRHFAVQSGIAQMLGCRNSVLSAFKAFCLGLLTGISSSDQNVVEEDKKG